jgi:hypothetical protein
MAFSNLVMLQLLLSRQVIIFIYYYDIYKVDYSIFQNCREENGVHTCDKRKTRTYIATSYPHFIIEDGFTELDELWSPTVRESEVQVAERARKVLDVVFQNDIDGLCKMNSILFILKLLIFILAVISITAHSGFINGFLKAVGRPSFEVPTGGES